jgi:hypothetical protein
MPGAMFTAFDDVADFQNALRGECEIELLVTGQGPFLARLTRISLSRIRLVAADERAARVAVMRVPDGMVRVALPAGDTGTWLIDEIAASAADLMIHGSGQRLHERTDGTCRWRTIWLAANDLALHVRSMTGGRFAVPGGMGVWRPAKSALKSLISLYDAAIRMARRDPRIFADSQTARGLEEQIILALTDCLQPPAIATSEARRGEPARAVVPRRR